MRQTSMGRWPIQAVAAAVALTSCLTAGQAWAVTVGRISVQSALGQPLQAELEVPRISDAEAASLDISIASDERFTAASMVRSAVLNDVQFELLPPVDGRSVIRMRSQSPITEPFLDMVLEFRWGGGQSLRTYTLLLDPPSLQAQSTPEPILAPALRANNDLPPLPTFDAAVVVEPASPDAPTPIADSILDVTPEPIPEVMPEPSEALAPAAPTVVAEERVTVRRGDTAGRIANSYLPAGISLDQMLIAMLQSNPDAFIDGNVNLVRAGAILTMPDAQAATRVSAPDARRLVQVQARDFNDYRRRVAGTARTQAADTPSQVVTGQIQDPVEVTPPADAAPDRLELTTGAPAQDAQSELIALNRQQEETQSRFSELDRNLQALEALVNATAPEEDGLGIPIGEVDVVASLEPDEDLLSLPATDTPEINPADAARHNATDMMASVVNHSLTLPAAVVLLLLLASLIALRVRQRRHANRFSQTVAAGTDARTAEPNLHDNASSLASDADPLPSQDPLSEAEVYLAYGMDEQAEVILSQAIASQPNALPERLKLLDIYSQRQDAVAFNCLAQEVFELTMGETDEWETVARSGIKLDPSNPLYHPVYTDHSRSEADLPADVREISLDLDPLLPDDTPPHKS